jgi:hypothetical protein
MAVKVRTWMWVVGGIVAACILMVIAMAGAGFYFFKQHIQTTRATSTSAASEFDAVRVKFSGQKPLIELDSHGNFLHANTDRAESDRRPEKLYVLAYDPNDGGLVRIEIPFWLLRMKMKGAINFGSRGNQLDLEDLKLTVEDLDRYGPALVLDQKNDDGDRVLVWSQ